jgi:hypothetical protein
MRRSVRSFLAVTFLVMALRGPAYQVTGSKQEKPAKELLTLSPDEEKQSYEIYSAVLEIREPRVSSWLIVQKTRGFEFCMKSGRDQDAIYRPMIQDYVQKNQKTVLLARKFNLPEYTLVTPEEWTRSTKGRSFAVFSAVGFNPDRTRATVCFWASSTGTCSMLVKKSTWQIDRDWYGQSCFWAA